MNTNICVYVYVHVCTYYVGHVYTTTCESLQRSSSSNGVPKTFENCWKFPIYFASRYICVYINRIEARSMCVCVCVCRLTYFHACTCMCVHANTDAKNGIGKIMGARKTSLCRHTHTHIYTHTCAHIHAYNTMLCMHSYIYTMWRNNNTSTSRAALYLFVSRQQAYVA
jgi:hypothetical protein